MNEFLLIAIGAIAASIPWATAYFLRHTHEQSRLIIEKEISFRAGQSLERQQRDGRPHA